MDHFSGLGAYAHGSHTHAPALVVGYAKPPEHAFTAAAARLAAVLREATEYNAWNAISVSTRAWVPGSYEP